MVKDDRLYVIAGHTDKCPTILGWKCTLLLKLLGSGCFSALTDIKAHKTVNTSSTILCATTVLVFELVLVHLNTVIRHLSIWYKTRTKKNGDMKAMAGYAEPQNWASFKPKYNTGLEDWSEMRGYFVNADDTKSRECFETWTNTQYILLAAMTKFSEAGDFTVVLCQAARHSNSSSKSTCVEDHDVQQGVGITDSSTPFDQWLHDSIESKSESIQQFFSFPESRIDSFWSIPIPWNSNGLIPKHNKFNPHLILSTLFDPGQAFYLVEIDVTFLLQLLTTILDEQSIYLSDHLTNPSLNVYTITTSTMFV